jgi:hypothetical protein
MLYNKREVSMAKFLKLTGVVLVSMLCIGVGAGCSSTAPKPSKEDNSRLEEAKAAAESAERKLSDLRMERMKLEQDLGAASSEEQSEKQEQEELQQEGSE